MPRRAKQPLRRSTKQVLAYFAKQIAIRIWKEKKRVPLPESAREMERRVITLLGGRRLPGGTIVPYSRGFALQVNRELVRIWYDHQPKIKNNPDLSHLHAIEVRLSNERNRLAQAKSAKEKAFRRVQVQHAEKELAGEYAFLGLTPPSEADKMSDDDLLRELGL